MFKQRLNDARLLLFSNWLLISAILILGTLYFCTLFSGFIAPYRYDSEARGKSYHPPMMLHFFDESGLTWPYVYEYQFEFNKYKQRVFKQVSNKKHELTFFSCGESYYFLGLFETDRHLFGIDGGTRLYLFGADGRGRDLFSRIIYGGRVSLTIGLVGVSISLFFGLLIGGISGYFGGLVDTVIQRIIEVIMLIPGFFLLLALRAAFPPEWSSIKVYFFIVIIMSFIGWASMARVIRGLALSLREKDFVAAAQMSGVPDLLIIIKHVIPNTASYFIVAATVSIPGYILGESALSLLGLGIQDPYASWGNLLQDAMSVSQIQLHPWILLPGLFIFLAIMSFNLLGDALRDLLDPEHEISGGMLA